MKVLYSLNDVCIDLLQKSETVFLAKGRVLFIICYMFASSTPGKNTFLLYLTTWRIGCVCTGLERGLGARSRAELATPALDPGATGDHRFF